MKDFQEVIDTDINNEIIYDEIYDGKTVKDMTDRKTYITDENYHKYNLEKVSDTCTRLNNEEHNKLYLIINTY